MVYKIFKNTNITIKASKGNYIKKFIIIFISNYKNILYKNIIRISRYFIINIKHIIYFNRLFYFFNFKNLLIILNINYFKNFIVFF